MILLIISIIYILITILFSTILLFRRKYNSVCDDALPVLFKYLLILLLYIIIIGASSVIFNHNVHYLDKYCGNICQYYTNDNYKLIIGLILNICGSFLFYMYTKKTIIKLFNRKLKYTILIIYTIIEYCGLLFGYFSFFKFIGIVSIDNILINIIRYITVSIPLLIYPVDMIITKIKER